MSSTDLAAVVLAAGSGRRLLPLTAFRPKALCPLNNVALVDHALDAVSKVTISVAVNAAHKAEMVADHLKDRAQLSIETGEALGTAGAVANLKDWIDGRDVLVCNSDAWHCADLRAMHESWDGEDPLLLAKPVVSNADFDGRKFIGASLLPWSVVSRLEVKPSGLWEVCWRDLHQQDRLRTFDYSGAFFDCGTPADYLAANLAVSGSNNVVAEGTLIKGEISRCVVWAGASVGSSERLRSCIRVSDELTVYVPSNEGSP